MRDIIFTIMRVDYALHEDEIYYIKKRGQETIYELCCQDHKTGDEKILLSNEDMAQFNAGNMLEANDELRMDISGKYLFLEVAGNYKYMCPIGGDIKKDSINLDSLFEDEGKSGDIQKAVYDGIAIERRVLNGEAHKYKIISIRDGQGYKILYPYADPSIRVDGKEIKFSKYRDPENFYYQVEGSARERKVSVICGDEYENSDINEACLTVEDGKIIALHSVSRHWAWYDELDQYNLHKDILFELDIESGESRKLYDTRNNLTKIIGYQDGIVYLVKKEKVYARELETRKETELFALSKGKDYIIDWQADYLIIREEFTSDQNGDIIAVYRL